MSRKRNYTVALKEKAVELSYVRGNVVEICRELDIPTSVLSRWHRESYAYGKNSFRAREIRNMKVKQKISGQFRTEKVAQNFEKIRFAIDTTIKNGMKVLDVLTLSAKLQLQTID